MRSLNTASPIVWTESPLVPIPEQNPPELPPVLPVVREIFAAKGESVSFQIGVQAPAEGNLFQVMVTASDFVNVDAEIPDSIASSNIVLYREAYIPKVSSTRADALIPFLHPENPDIPLPAGAPFSVNVGSRQPVWVDIHVPRTANAGKYEARFTITSNRPTVHFTVMLTVWNFALPVQPTLKSAFLMQQAPTLFLAKELLRHRLMPKDHLALQPGRIDILASAWPELLGLGLNIAAIPVHGQTLGHDKMDAPKSTSELKAIAAPYGRELPLYCYSADEIRELPSLFPQVKAWAENLHAAGIRQLITLPPTPELYCDRRNCLGESRRSAVDIWVVLPFQYDASAFRHVRMKGDEVWSYNSENQETYKPRWRFESQPIEFRIQPGFYSQARGLTGLLYWGVDYWKNGVFQVWRDAMGLFAPGDGMLVYPGDAVDLPGYVVPSMRLKWLRDGVNDFDYVEMLKQNGRGDYAMYVARHVSRNWETWAPSELEGARKMLGEALSDPVKIPELIPNSEL